MTNELTVGDSWLRRLLARLVPHAAGDTFEGPATRNTPNGSLVRVIQVDGDLITYQPVGMNFTLMLNRVLFEALYPKRVRRR